jgi:hypothetical protein
LEVSYGFDIEHISAPYLRVRFSTSATRDEPLVLQTNRRHGVIVFVEGSRVFVGALSSVAASVVAAVVTVTSFSVVRCTAGGVGHLCIGAPSRTQRTR